MANVTTVAPTNHFAQASDLRAHSNADTAISSFLNRFLISIVNASRQGCQRSNFLVKPLAKPNRGTRQSDLLFRAGTQALSREPTSV